ncbi:MAG TPA: T9SS type A sorting domain-containing protein [Flavobacteriaceae bacterium]|nr:T9SS type A sorting domain-containing protein [Flavobacteriaceae bacterium]
MKTKLKLIFIGIFICGFSNILKAQEVENPPEALTDQTWYLTKMIIDEEEMPFNPNEEIENVELIIGELYGSTASAGVVFCDGGGAEIILEGEDEFYMGILMFLMNMAFSDETTNSYCDLEENMILDDIYFYEFWNNSELDLGNTAPQPYHFYYTINQLEEHQELIVTNDNGDEAHYKSAPNMSVEDQQKSSLTIFPNPVKNHLYIENLTENVQLTIYDLSGMKLLSQEINTSTESISLSHLSGGMYFYEILQNGKTIKTGKLIKN